MLPHQLLDTGSDSLVGVSNDAKSDATQPDAVDQRPFKCPFTTFEDDDADDEEASGEALGDELVKLKAEE